MNKKKWYECSFIFSFIFVCTVCNPGNLFGNSAKSISICRDEPQKIHVSVEQMPEFKDGRLEDYIKNNLRYPEIAEELEIEGRVIVRFVVDKEGYVRNPEIQHSTNKEFNKETIRLVEEMPQWNPGKQNGEEVAVYFTMPVLFKLPR